VSLILLPLVPGQPDLVDLSTGGIFRLPVGAESNPQPQGRVATAAEIEQAKRYFWGLDNL
jgi:hypothetical protein